MTLSARFAWSLLLIAGVLGVRGLWADVMQGDWIGVCVMALLVSTAVVAGRSLERARRFLFAEHAALAAGHGSGSELLNERRARLVELAAKGVQPDVQALRDASEAALHMRGALGRYFVGATLLIGLVGTFAGVMATLGEVSPLLSGAATGVSLRGLDLTFASSIVAIVITLGLLLLNGEITALEASVLAHLDERTAHVLVPDLWPRAERGVLARLEDSTGVQRETLAVLQQLVQLQARTETLAQRQIDAIVTLHAGAGESRAALQAVSVGTSQAVERLTSEVAARLTTCIDELGTRLGLIATRVEDASASAARSQTEHALQVHRALLTSVEHAMERIEAAHAGSSSAVNEMLSSSTRTATEALVQTLQEVGAAHATGSSQLDASASKLAEVITALAPMAQKLTGELLPQLRALSEQIALLGVQSESELELATFTELERLSGHVDELAALMRMARPGVEVKDA